MSERTRIVAAIYPEGTLRPTYERDWRSLARQRFAEADSEAVEAIARVYRAADDAMRSGDVRTFNELSRAAGRKVEALDRQLCR